MATHREGTVRVEIWVEPEVRDRLRELAESHDMQVNEVVPRLLAAGERILADQEAAEGDRRAIGDERRDILRRSHELEEREAALDQAQALFERQRRLDAVVAELFAELAQAGIVKDDLVALAQAFATAGVRPTEAIEAIQKLGGIRPYADTARAALERVLAERQRASQQMGQLRIEMQQLEGQRQDVTQRVGEITKLLQDTQARLAQTQAEAQELGFFVDFTRRAGGRRGQTPEAGFLLAGAILHMVCEAHGDRQIPIGPNMAAGRFAQVPLLMSELAEMLAPRPAMAQLGEAMREQEAAMAAAMEGGRRASAPPEQP